jgi:hypothetical protein
VTVAEALSDSVVEEIASEAPFAHVAVETARGPHVTPVLYALAGDRLWFTVPRGTLKARVLAKRSRAGILLQAGGVSVVMAGEAKLLDPLRPLSWASRPWESALAPLAIQTFSARNSRELLGFALDRSRMPAQSFPPNLLLAGYEPRRVAVVRGEEVESRRGRWRFEARKRGSPSAGARRSSRGTLPPLEGIPREVAELPRRRGPAVVGWPASGTPLALPAAWDPDSARAAVSGDLIALTGIAGEAAACIAFDAAEGHRPTGKRGVMLRGRGSVARGGNVTEVSIQPERVTYWLGFETGTISV